MRSHHHSVCTTVENRSKPEHRVEHTVALLQDAIEHLFRRGPAHLGAEAAREDLLELRSHLEDALGALADIERHRSLTNEELTRQRAFKMLLLNEAFLL
jgi:hypothetical protein